MNLDNEYNIAARYRSIRKHLDSLGYRQALSLDALPLIEKLLSDLIQTTDSLKHFKAVAHDNVEACSRLQLSIDPYKCDNARLVQECNQLHLDLIEAKENHQKQIKDLKKKIYNLESECNDLQSGSSRNLKRIKELETESAQKSKRIQELLGKCNKPLINNVALASKKRPCYPLRRPNLEAEPMPRSKSISALPSHSKVDPQVVDLVGMADRKIGALSHEVTALKSELSLHADTVYTLKTQLATKEKEISRLRQMLEGGRPYSAVSRDCSCKKIGQTYDHGDYEKTSDVHSACVKSVDDDESRILEKCKTDLEQQLREALKKQHEAMSQAMKLAERNEELEKELRDIDHIALAVEADCNSVVKENNKRVGQLQEKLESVMTQVHVLEGELMVERRSGQELRADLEGARLDNRNLRRKLESSLDEKKKLTDRINQLTVIEKNLNDEIGEKSRINDDLKREIGRLDCVNNLLKKQMIGKEMIVENVDEDSPKLEKNWEKNDKNKGKMLTKKKSISRGQRRSLSPPILDKPAENVKRYSNVRDDEVTRDSNVEPTKKTSRTFDDDENGEKIVQLRQTIEKIQGDRDFYKKEYNRLRERFMKNSEADNAELWGQVCELRRQLIDKEQAVMELQKEKKDLCREKFELELRLQSSRSERKNIGHSCGQCRPSVNCACSMTVPLAGGDSKASSAVLERLERERDMARADVDRLVEERDTLRERLKLAVEAHKFEQRRLRESLCDVETRMKKLEREKQDVLVAQGTQRAKIDGLEDQLEDAREELRRTKQELSTQRTQYLQLRTLQDQADQALGDVQGQLNHSESELYRAMDRNRVLEQQRQQLDDEVKSLKEEMNNLRSNRNQVDQEKDQLMMDLEDKAGKIAVLEREIKAKEQEASSAEQRFQELQHKNQLCVDQSAEQERRLRNMQMEMEIHQRQLAAASTDRDNAAQENRRLQDDLAAVTCEIRTLQRELEVSRAESHDLKKQLQTYVSEVRRAEDLINKKENERTEMLNHFRSLSLEATMLENSNHSLESEAAEARGALQAAQDRTMDLERQLADNDCLVRGYEMQITELTQTVASLETQIRQQMDQRQRAEADLNAVRDLCVKLDQQKENLVKELGDKDAMKAQYEAQLARLKTEQSMVQDQINRDHLTVERLETLLDQARQESMDSQQAKQELQCEMSRLKQRTCELQNKLSAESAELRRYQNQAAEYSKQIAELRRQVTNERFDRARKEEEHRRNCLCGESGNSSRRENFSRETSQVPSQNRRLVNDSVNANADPTLRYPRNGKMLEYRNRADMTFEARRTNRFNGSTSKPSTLTYCKCSESNEKISNEANDEKTTTKNSKIDVTSIAKNSKMDVTSNAKNSKIDATSNTEISGTTRASKNDVRREFVDKGMDNAIRGNLRVRATVEEDSRHKDIRVRISDASGFSNFDGNADRIVKLCAPVICKETKKTTKLSMVESLNRKFGTNGDETTRETNVSTKIDEKIVRDSNDKSANHENREDRRRIENNEEIEFLQSKRTNLSNDDDTSGYHTSETTKLRGSEYYRTNDKSNETITESKKYQNRNENTTTDVFDKFTNVKSELEGNRSKSVPRKITDKKYRSVRTNFSGPVNVDRSEAAMTAEDLTRPEFVRWLTEVKEKTKNVERELSRMNNTLTKNRTIDDSSNLNRLKTFDEKMIQRFPESYKSAAKYDSTISEKFDGTNKRKKDESSQIDFFDCSKIVSSTPRSSKNYEIKSAIAENFGKKMYDGKIKSNVAFAKNERISRSEKWGNEKSRNTNDFTRNRKYDANFEESSATQTNFFGPSSTRLVDESTLWKPSKIHKLKNSSSPKIRRSTEKLFVDESTSPKIASSPTRTNRRSMEFISGRSFIPTRNSSPEKLENSPKRRILRSSFGNINELKCPTMMERRVNYSGVDVDRRPTNHPENRDFHRSRSREVRSRSLNSTGTTLADDSVSIRHLRNSKSPIFESSRRSRVAEIERTHNDPKKPISSKTTKISDESKNSTMLERSSIEREMKNREKSSRDGSIDNTREKLLSRRNRTIGPEIGKFGGVDRSLSRDGRSESSSPRRRSENPAVRLLERRVSAMDRSKERYPSANEQRSSRSSPNSTHRSRKFDSERESFRTNYRTNRSKRETGESVERSDYGRKNEDGRYFVREIDARTKKQQ